MSRLPSATTVSILVCATLALTVAPAALAAPSWLMAVDISGDPQTAANPQVAVDPQGDSVAVWEQSGVVRAAARPAGGPWETSTRLSLDGQHAGSPQVAIDPQGNAVAVWVAFSAGQPKVVQAAARPAGAAWQTPADLSGGDAVSPQVAVDPNGNAVAVWELSDGTKQAVQAATRAAGANWQAAADISVPAQPASVPQVAVDPQGNAVAVWQAVNGSNSAVQAAAHAADGNWQTPVDLSAPGESASGPQVALGPQGNAVAVWDDGAGFAVIVRAAAHAATGNWQAPVNLSPADGIANVPRAAIDPQGNAVAVWQQLNDHNYVVRAATHAASGGWQPPVAVSDAHHNAGSPEVAVDPRGNAIAVWQQVDGSTPVVYAAARTARSTAGGGWQAPLALSAAGSAAPSPQVAVDPRGNAIAVWDQVNGASSIVQAAGYDVTGPVLRALSIPASGVAGRPVTFSVSPLDVWSPLAQTNWGFGDGASAIGPSVTHAYTAPGSYQVTLGSADALANITAASGTITIAQAPTTPPDSAPPPGNTPPPGSAPPTAGPPRISAASLTHKRFRIPSQATSSATARQRAPTGTRLRFTLSATARLQIAITWATGAVRRGRGCVAPTRALERRHAGRCVRTLTVGSLIRAREPAGADGVAFSGRIGRRALRPGSYKATLRASNAAGRSRPVALSFAVVR